MSASADKDRVIDGKKMESELLSLRPRGLTEFIGQEGVREKLRIFIQAALQRGESLDHVLLSGPPGLGKTTLANIVASEMKSQIHEVAGPNVEKKGDLAAVLSNLQENDVLFVDEVHRLHRSIEEILYSAMEDFKLDLIVGQGPSARTIRIDLPKFTLVGATTRSGLLSKPLLDRFGVQLRVDFYSPKDLQKVILRSSKILGLKMDEDSALEIAKRSRGTPRVANRLLKRVRDYSQVEQRSLNGKIQGEVVRSALQFLEIDDHGLDPMDQKFLLTILNQFEGGPVGVESIAAALGESSETIEDVLEPFLIQSGFLQRTSRGRVALRKCYERFGREFIKPTESQIGI